MIILIAESKTMAPCYDKVSEEELRSHTPVFETEADSIMASLGDLSAGELAETVKISPAMVKKLRGMAYEFPNKQLGSPAITAFTGVVFKAFAYPTLSDEEKERTSRVVRIISSLYGWLRPDDIVKPYRLDFTTPLAPDGMSFAAFWKPRVTAQLQSAVTTSSTTDILDLLPGDAARCIDWKKLGPGARVWKADFKEVMPGGKMRTPNAGRLKTLRGELLRQIIRDDITDPRHLSTLEGENFTPDGIDEETGVIRFQADAGMINSIF